ncbi:MAG: response regulator [Ruminiclostridium sp.]|nr:response regulator [Ruminiclostridium sp.]
MKKSTGTRQFLTAIILIFLLQAIMLTVIFSSFYGICANDIKELGISNMKSQAAMVENYLNRGNNVLWFAAESVEHLMKYDNGNDEILGYLTDATVQMQRQFDINFTGLYGYINGEYIDGSGWVPNDDYDATARSWYTQALGAGGDMVVSEPYVDAQTGEVVISFSQLLSDGKSVLSLDVILTEVQNITENMTMGNMGYGFIVDSSGLVIAHYDKGEIGKNYSDITEWNELLSVVYADTGNENEIVINNVTCTAFSERIVKDWYVVVVANNELLFANLQRQLLFGILMSVGIYLIIVIFCIVSIKRIRAAEKSERESMDQLRQMNMSIIRSLSYAIDAKERYTRGHSQRVAEYSLALAKRMGKSEKEQETIYFAGLLHDVGKIRVPEAVINKPGKLTDEEFDQIRIHPVSGYHILRDISKDERIGYGAKYHHERYDGTGYPNGLMGDNIPEIARIIGVADAYDAMASNRSYRSALPQEVVRQEIEKGRGRQFDPAIADVMLGMIDEDKEYKMCQKQTTDKNILVVDDELMNIKMVGRIFKDIPTIHIISAMNRDETMSELANNDIDLILLDLKMPDIDGFELYKIIREKYNTPVVIMTADKSSDTVQRINELGIDDYLTKPLNKFVTQEMVYGMINYKRDDL